MRIDVLVLSSDKRLRAALAARLRSIEWLAVAESGALQPRRPASIVLASASERRPEDCARLAASGLHVIVLAPTPSEREHQRYLDAGVDAYLPMAIDTKPLESAIARIAAPAGCPSGLCPGTPAPLAAPAHAPSHNRAPHA